MANLDKWFEQLKKSVERHLNSTTVYSNSKGNGRGWGLYQNPGDKGNFGFVWKKPKTDRLRVAVDERWANDDRVSQKK